MSQGRNIRDENVRTRLSRTGAHKPGLSVVRRHEVLRGQFQT